MPTDLRPPVQGVNATEYISVLDIERPVIMDKLFERKGDQWYEYFMMIMKAWGFEIPVNQQTYSHYEDDDWIRPIRVGAGGLAGGLGGSQVAFDITLDAGDVFTDAMSGVHVFPRKGDVFMLPTVAGGVRDKEVIVVGVTPATPKVTVQFKQAAWTTDALAAGTNIILVSGAFAEGSSFPDSVIDNLVKKSNRLQIIKEKWAGTGTEMTNGKWITHTSGGRNIRQFYADGQYKMDYRMLYKIDGALMWSQNTEQSPGILDTTPEATTRKLYTTTGLAPWIRTEGTEVPYPIGGFTMSKFDFIAKIIENNRGSDMYMWLHGFDLGTELRNTLQDFLKESVVAYTSPGASTEQVIKIGFKQITTNNVTHIFKKYGAMSNTGSYAATGFEAKQNFAFIMPVGMKKAYQDSSKTSSRDAGMFGYRYKADGPFNRRMVVATMDGINGMQPARTPVMEADVSKYYSMADVGFQGMCGNKFILLQGQ